jgi:hypothetical protein
MVLKVTELRRVRVVLGFLREDTDFGVVTDDTSILIRICCGDLGLLTYALFGCLDYACEDVGTWLVL